MSKSRIIKCLADDGSKGGSKLREINMKNTLTKTDIS